MTNQISGNRLYTYVIVRKDLPVYYQIIQSCHAVQEISLDQVGVPVAPIHLILLQVKNEKELKKANFYVESCGIKTHMFYEPDYGTGFTAVASEVIPWDDVYRRTVFEKFDMFK